MKDKIWDRLQNLDDDVLMHIYDHELFNDFEDDVSIIIALLTVTIMDSVTQY